ncbi:hypothetical protein ACP70R_026239 [Stipagrostis hirtigluma subsp. patula]
MGGFAPETNCSATTTMDSSEALEGAGGGKVVAEPVIGGLPSLDEIDSSDEDVPPLLRALKPNKTKKIVRRLTQREIDYPTRHDEELKALRDELAEAMWMSREYNRQYQKLVRQEYEAKGYVDMEFIVCADDFEDKLKKKEDKDEKAQ